MVQISEMMDREEFMEERDFLLGLHESTIRVFGKLRDRVQRLEETVGIDTSKPENGREEETSAEFDSEITQKSPQRWKPATSDMATSRTPAQHPSQSEIPSSLRGRSNRTMRATSTCPPPALLIPDREVLSQAVTAAQPSHVRELLVKICSIVPSAHTIAMQQLTVYEDNLLYENILQEDCGAKEEEYKWRAKEAAEGNPWWKQRCVRLQKCLRCQEEFQVDANRIGSCKWHPGTKVIDKAAGFFLCKKEFRRTSPSYLESLVDDDRYAPGFMWDCCNESLANKSAGCVEGRHLRTWNNPATPETAAARPARKRLIEEEDTSDRSPKRRAFN